MEPITAVAAKHGIRKLVDALPGNQGIGDLAAELFESQLASEDRLDRRLAAIEHRFDDVLEQPYTTAVRTGLRTLSDANTATTAQAREDEFMRARDLFREASAAARSALQVAVAERYVVLCTLALGRPDAAGNALRRLERNALTALPAARARSGFPARHAVAQLQAGQELGPAAKPGRLSARLRELVPPIQEADVAVNRVAGRLLQEAAVPLDRRHRLSRRPVHRRYGRFALIGLRTFGAARRRCHGPGRSGLVVVPGRHPQRRLHVGGVPGETEARLTCSLWPEWSFTTLEIDDVLTFPFGTGPDLT